MTVLVSTSFLGACTHRKTDGKNDERGEKIVETIMIIGIGVVIGIFFLLFVRLRRFYRLRRVNDLARYSEEFRKKYYLFKEKETQRTTLTFMVISVLLSSLLLGMFGLMFQLTQQVQAIDRKDQISREVVRTLFERVEEVPIVKGSKENQVLEGYSNTGKIFENKQLQEQKERLTEKERITLEQQLSKELVPYIGKGTVAIVQEEQTNKMSLVVSGSIEPTAENISTLSENITAMILQTEKASAVEEIHFQVKSLKSKEQKVIYEETFVRTSNGQTLELQKNVRKGKG